MDVIIDVIDSCWVQNSQDKCADSSPKIHRESNSSKEQEVLLCRAWKTPSQKNYIPKMIGREVAKKVKDMVSDKVKSVLQSQNVDQLESFCWAILLQQFSEFAPILKRLLTYATKTRLPRSNTDAVIGFCAAILLNHRNPKMNLIQQINSIILYAGHSSKQVWKWYSSPFLMA